MSKIKQITEYSVDKGWRNLFQESIWLLEGFIGSKISNRQINKNHVGRYLNLGCGTLHFDNWVNADYFRFKEFIFGGERWPDWMLDATKIWLCPDNFFGGIFCEHAIEHIPYSGAITFLSECYRTLQEDRYIRLIVPDLNKYIRYYNGEFVDEEFGFPDKTIALSSLTQKWGHVSVWEKDLLIDILTEIGFTNIKQVDFQKGSDPDLSKDLIGRRWESVYIEAQKPSQK